MKSKLEGFIICLLVQTKPHECTSVTKSAFACAICIYHYQHADSFAALK